MFFGEKRITPQKEDCCGCSACVHVCKKQALTMVSDVEGFLYPMLNSDKCVECGACEKVCPMVNGAKSKNGHPLKILAAQLKDMALLQQSSSGGVFSAIEIEVIRRLGVVYGASFNSKQKLSHIRIDTIEGLNKLRGSKYLQSNLSDCFYDVKKDLKEGKLVYFVGTPCQVAGLKLFLRQDFNTLLTSDIVCHGTPSQKVFDCVITQIELTNKGIVQRYSFRDKSVMGWNCASSSSLIHNLQNGTMKNLTYSASMRAYFKAFIGGHLMRFSCYKCPFATEQRCSDITLADFWGLPRQHFKNFKVLKGVSLVMINTIKGKNFWDAITKNLVVQEEKFENASKTNRNLLHPSKRGDHRDIAYQLAFSNFNKFENLFLGDRPQLDHIKFIFFRFMRRSIIYKIYKFIYSFI